jgi:catechol 2,3-dioxygenase-like lactoylglutathione lyase family enzyme
MSDWYSRPVFFVQSVERSIDFYTQKLGFTEGPRHAEDGKLLVGQASRQGCTIIFTCQEPAKTGRGRMFLALDLDPFNALKAEFESRDAPVKDGWWGTATMLVEDPDGNELVFPYP